MYSQNTQNLSVCTEILSSLFHVALLYDRARLETEICLKQRSTTESGEDWADC